MNEAEKEAHRRAEREAAEQAARDELAGETREILARAGAERIRVEFAGAGWLIAIVLRGVPLSAHTSIDPNTSDDPRDLARRLIEGASAPPATAAAVAIEHVQRDDETPDLFEHVDAGAPAANAEQLEAVNDATHDNANDRELAGDESQAEAAGERLTIEVNVQHVAAEAGPQLVALNPGAWRTLSEAQAQIRGAIALEHARLTSARQGHLERVLELTDPRSPLTPTGEAELAQHRQWAQDLARIDDVKARKLEQCAALVSIDEAIDYAPSILEGWQ